MSFGDIDARGGASSGRGSYGGEKKTFGGIGSTYQNPTGEAEHERLLGVVTNNIQQIQYNVNRLNKMVQTLGTDKDTKDHRDKLKNMVAATNNLAKDTGEAFKKFAHTTSDNPQKARLVQDKLRKDFELWLREFQEVSKLSVAKERQSAPRPDDDSAVFKGIGSGSNAGLAGTAGGSGAYFDEHEEAALERQRVAEERRQEFQQLEQKRELERAMIMERDQGIRQIEQSVTTVNEIFMDLATLVEEQGTMIDNIESNIVTAEKHTEQGTSELRKASDYQKKARKKLCYLLLCLAVLCAIAAGAIYFLAK